MKEYIKFYFQTLNVKRYKIARLHLGLWLLILICAIISEFTQISIYENVILEFSYLSLAVLISTVMNAFVEFQCEQQINKDNIKEDSIMEKSAMETKIMETPRIKNGDIVRHFKRETANIDADPNVYLYKVIDVDAREVDNYTRVVIYESLYDNGGIVKHGDVFVRNYEEFMSEVDHVKYPDIKQKYRFEVV